MVIRTPKKAKLVFKGEIFEVYQWKQRMFDGTYQTFERLKRPYTVEIIATFKDKVLIAHEEQPLAKRELGLFAGRMEKRESPIKAAKRELLEESGMASKNWRLIKIFNPVSKIDWKIYLFIASGCRKVSTQHLDNGEKISVERISFERFMSLSHRFSGELGNYLSEINESKVARNRFKQLLFAK